VIEPSNRSRAGRARSLLLAKAQEISGSPETNKPPKGTTDSPEGPHRARKPAAPICFIEQKQINAKSGSIRPRPNLGQIL